MLSETQNTGFISFMFFFLYFIVQLTIFQLFQEISSTYSIFYIFETLVICFEDLGELEENMTLQCKDTV